MYHCNVLYSIYLISNLPLYLMYGKIGSVRNNPPNVLHMGINCYRPRTMTMTMTPTTTTHFKFFLLPEWQ